MAVMFDRKALYPATQHRTNAIGDLVCPGCVISRYAVTDLDVIDTDPRFQTLGRIRARKVPPRLVHRKDDPVAIEQSDLCGQRVENSGLVIHVSSNGELVRVFGVHVCNPNAGHTGCV